MPAIVTAEELARSGPFPAGRADVLVFSQGADVEWHGPALPPDTDSRTTFALASRFIERTGATFAGHVPFTSDRVGEVARDWLPAYIPYDEFKARAIGFIKQTVGLWPRRPAEVILLMGHGGVLPLVDEMGEVAEAIGLPARAFFLPGLGAGRVKIPEFEGADTLREIVAGKGEHAYIMEHSIAAALGFMSWARLEELNRLAATDPEEALRKWPPLAGLGGFIKFGGSRYHELARVVGTFCADDFIRRRKLPVSVEAGAALVEAQVADLCARAFPESCK